MRNTLVVVATLLVAGCATEQKSPFDERMTSAAAARSDGLYSQAVIDYREALRINPASADAHNNLGSALFDMGQTDAAMLEFQRALLLSPDLAAAHNNMGSALLSKGEAAEAVGYFRHAVTLQPQMAIARFNLCLGLETLGQYPEALLQCEMASQAMTPPKGIEEAISRLKERMEQEIHGP